MNELFDNVHNINIEDLFFLWEAKIGILSREEIICSFTAEAMKLMLPSARWCLWRL